MLLEKTECLNSFNNDGWAPIHIASRRVSVACVSCILEKNKALEHTGKQVFDVNLKVNFTKF
jgi:ankyrin repeat protein